MPSIEQKNSWRTYRNFLLSFIQTPKPTQISESDFPEKFEQVEKTNCELELKKTLGCFLYGYGSYTCNFVTFKLKSL